MANSQAGTMRDGLEGLGPYRLAEPNPDAAERARAIKRRQKDRGVRFSDSTEVVRADRDSR
jgi:predicted nucleic acid-binding protein